MLRAALSLAEYRRDELRSDEGERDEDERIDAKRETKFAMSAWSSFERGSGWTVPSTPDRAELSSCAHGGAKKGVSEVQARCVPGGTWAVQGGGKVRGISVWGGWGGWVASRGWVGRASGAPRVDLGPLVVSVDDREEEGDVDP